MQGLLNAQHFKKRVIRRHITVMTLMFSNPIPNSSFNRDIKRSNKIPALKCAEAWPVLLKSQFVRFFFIAKMNRYIEALALSSFKHRLCRLSFWPDSNWIMYLTILSCIFTCEWDFSTNMRHRQFFIFVDMYGGCFQDRCWRKLFGFRAVKILAFSWFWHFFLCF